MSHSLGLRSRLYDCVVTHSRNNPTRHRFVYRYLTFCLDLDEVEKISNRSKWIGLGPLSVFRFCGKDLIFNNLGFSPAQIKASVIEYAQKKGIAETIQRVEFLGHLRTFGYSFNPAAFYFCYNHLDQPICAIVEVTNTYREKKSYFIERKMPKEAFESRQPKLFYVSPFVELDTEFRFNLEVPREHVFVQIDSFKEGNICLHSVLTGNRVPLNDFNLFKALLSNPMITMGIMFKIHLQALQLYLKGVPSIRKKDRTELQQGGQL